ncbi:hypothetical protein MBLNU457_6064t1 [Dothideomycetes sp. NU457]
MYKATTNYVFDNLSWLTAKKNKEELAKKNPKNPVLDQSDEEFLHRVASKEAPIAPLPPTVIKEDGTEEEASQQAADKAGTVALPQSPAAEETKDPHNAAPEKKADSGEDKVALAEEKAAHADEDAAPAGKEAAPADDKAAPSDVKAASADDKAPSADEMAASAEEKADDDTDKTASGDQDSKKTEDAATNQSSAAAKDETKSPKQTKSTWSSYVPSIPSMTWRSNKTTGDKESVDASTKDNKDESKDKVDEKTEGQMPAGVTITEDVKLNDNGTETQDEKEVSVLLDKLHLSSINNRVFSFSQKSQDIYSEFTVILKDMINGVPTAYQDMEKLMKDNEGHLSETFASMPPFVQTLIKSMPSKLGTTLGPEIFAAAGDKPGADMKARLDAASHEQPQKNKNKKRKVPDIKSIAKDRGMVTTMLSNIVNFLKLRFPFLLTTTNVVMTLSTFILLLVFWYCHKRGKEVRLSREAEAQLSAASDASEADEDDDDEDLNEKEEQEEAVAVPDDDKSTEKPKSSTADSASESRDAQSIIEEAESKQKA